MITTERGHRPPRRLIGLDEARAEHGEAADRMARKLDAGDPLADAVIAELDELGKAGQRVLNAGLSRGLDSLQDPPPAITALLRHLESVPDYVDPAAIERGDTVTLSVPPLWFAFAFSAGSLTHTYTSPPIARLLVQSGRLTTMAPRRLAETGLWSHRSALPSGLEHGAPGYIATAQVRLLHARVAATAMKHGWDREQWGRPINQVDIARTWLDFTVVPFRALEAVGIVLTDAEQHSLYEYWWYVGHLLGLDPEFYLGIRDHASATSLLHLLDSTVDGPDENSRALVAALIDAQAEILSAGPQPLMPRDAVRALMHALIRSFHGDRVADALRVPHSPFTPMLPLIAMGNAGARRWQSATPETAAMAGQELLAMHRQFAAPEPSDGTAFQQHVGSTRTPPGRDTVL